MRLALTAVSAAIVLVAACGGATGSDLFNGETADSGGDATTDGASGSDGSTGTGDAHGPNADAAPPNDAGIADTGLRDAGPIDATPGNPGIYCGTAVPGYCLSGTQVCCRGGTKAAPTYKCNAPATVTSCVATLPILCDEGADCTGGKVCCGQLNATTGYKSVQCLANCAGTAQGDTLVKFCNPNAAVDECKGLNKTCVPVAALPGYFRCE